MKSETKTTMYALILFGCVISTGVCNQPPDEKTQTETKQSATQKPEQEILGNFRTWEPTSFFTGALAVIGFVQVGIFVWQLYLIRRSVDEAKRATDIANKIYVEHDRPHIFVNIHPHWIMRHDPGGHLYDRVQFSAMNYGRIPASVIECRVSLTQTGFTPQLGRIRDAFHVAIDIRDIKDDWEVDPSEEGLGCTYREGIDDDGHPSEELNHIRPKQSDAYDSIAYIRVIYKGVGSQTYETKAAWRWDHDSDRWAAITDPDYSNRT